MSVSSCTGKFPTSVCIGTYEAGKGIKLVLVGAKKFGPSPRIWVNGFFPTIATGPDVPASNAYWMVDGNTGAAFKNAACALVTGTTTAFGGKGCPIAADTKREMSACAVSPKLFAPISLKPVSWRFVPS